MTFLIFRSRPYKGPLILTLVYFPKPHSLCPVLQYLPFRHNPIPTNSRQDFRPSGPICHTQQKDAHANDRENVVRVSIWVDGACGWDKGDDGEEDIGEEEEDDDGEVGVPWGCPFFVRSIVEVYEAGGDEGVYPGTGVGVAVPDGISGKRKHWEKGFVGYVGGGGGGRTHRSMMKL